MLAATSTASSSVSLAGSVVSLAILGFILHRQRQVRALRTRPALPIVLVVAGLSSLTSATSSKPLSGGQGEVLVALLVFDAIGLGALRALTVRLWSREGVVFRQGGRVTVVLWLLGFAVHGGVDALAHITSASLLLYVGLTLAAQRLVLAARARRPGQVASDPPDAALRRRGARPARNRSRSALRRPRWPTLLAWVLAVVLLEPLASGLSNASAGLLPKERRPIRARRRLDGDDQGRSPVAGRRELFDRVPRDFAGAPCPRTSGSSGRRPGRPSERACGSTIASAIASRASAQAAGSERYATTSERYATTLTSPRM